MNHVWCYDFLSDQTSDGRTLKLLTIEDEYTRQSLAIEVRPWDMRRIRFEASGAQRFRLTPKSGKDYTANAGGVTGVASVGENGSLKAISLEFGEPRITEAEAGSIVSAGRILADLSRPEIPPIAHTETSLGLAFELEKVELKRLEPGPLGATIASARLKAEFLGPLSGATPREALTAWRDSGGTLEIQWFNMVWGALDLRANGTAALDEEMRPLGALTADIRGYEETLSALADAGLLRRDFLPASRVTLNLLAKQDESDGRRVLTAPITAQDGALMLGPIRVLELPPLLRTTNRRPAFPQG